MATISKLHAIDSSLSKAAQRGRVDASFSEQVEVGEDSSSEAVEGGEDSSSEEVEGVEESSELRASISRLRLIEASLSRAAEEEAESIGQQEKGVRSSGEEEGTVDQGEKEGLSSSLSELERLDSRLDASLRKVEGSLIEDELQTRLRSLQALRSQLDTLSLDNGSPPPPSSSHPPPYTSVSVAPDVDEVQSERRMDGEEEEELEQQLRRLANLSSSLARVGGEEYVEQREVGQQEGEQKEGREEREAFDAAKAALHEQVAACLEEDEANLPLLHQLLESVTRHEDFTDRIRVLRAAQNESSLLTRLQTLQARHSLHDDQDEEFQRLRKQAEEEYALHDGEDYQAVLDCPHVSLS